MNESLKHLFLMRHASAGPGADDRARPLSPAGRGDALRVGRALAALGTRPEWALVSPARRAHETFEVVRAELPGLAGAETDETLYVARGAELLVRLERVPEETSRLLLIGHNPGLSELLRALVASAPGAEPRAARGLAPGAVAVLRIERRWRELAAGGGQLLEVLTPG